MTIKFIAFFRTHNTHLIGCDLFWNNIMVTTIETLSTKMPFVSVWDFLFLFFGGDSGSDEP